MKFLHTMIRTYNLEKSLNFYTELFDLKPVKKATLEDCTLYFLKDEKTNVEIELTDNFEKPRKPYLKGESFGHFAFEIDNFDDFTKKMKEKNYQYFYEPFDIVLHTENKDEKLKIAFINDPDGNEIELIEKNEEMY